MITKDAFLKIALEQKGNYFDNSDKHVRNIQTTVDYLLEEGRCDYKILIPGEPQDRELRAAEELHALFSEATGVTLPIVTDNELTYDHNGKYLSIGHTKLAKKAGLACDYETLTQQGYYIKSFKNGILFVGHTDFGALYAVYDFLEDILHYDYFTPGVYAIDKNVKDIPLKHYDVKEVPDIGAFSRNYGTLCSNEYTNVLDRFRMSEREETLLTVDGLGTVHNMMLFLKPEEYKDKHPKWYTEKTQDKYWAALKFEECFCFTAHGDEEEYKLLVEGVAGKVKSEMKSGAKGEVMCFGQGDGSPACACPACAALKEKYGSDTAACIKFLGDVLDDVYAWFKTDDGKPYTRNFRFVILAYLAYEFAPVTYHEDTKTFTINGDLPVHEKLGFFMAPIKYDYGAPSTSSQNVPYYRNILSWAAATNLSAFYTYDFNTRYFFVPNETLENKQELYRLMAGLNCMFLYDQGQWVNHGIPPAFSQVKIYVSTKLRWNVNYDVEELIERFFKGAYGPAYETIKALYWDFRKFWKKTRERAELNQVNPRHVNYCGALIGEQDIWEASFPMLEEWLQRYDKVLEEAEEARKESSARYATLRRDIVAERVSVIYLLLLRYSNRYSVEKLQDLRLQFKESCELLRMHLIKEGNEGWDGRHNELKDIYKDWGLEE